jgi:hypothetical protein
MIMAVTQQFRIDHGDWVCAGCGAPMAEREADQAVVMTHADDCPEVSGGAPAGA